MIVTVVVKSIVFVVVIVIDGAHYVFVNRFVKIERLTELLLLL